MNIDEVLEKHFSQSQERPLEDSCQQSKKPTDEELIISCLETLIALLKQHLNKIRNNKLPNTSVDTNLLHPQYAVQQTENTILPQVTFQGPSKPHYTDVFYSQNS